MKSGIYQIINLINGKIYIGSAINLINRKSIHFIKLKRNIHENKYLQNSWNKYGKEYFEFNILENCEKENLIKREQYYLDILNPEYNISPIAGSQLGFKFSEESKRKMSITRIGKKVSIKTKNKMSISKLNNKNSIGRIDNRYFPNEEIINIRKSKLSQRQLANEYGVSPTVINRIINFLSYKDVR